MIAAVSTGDVATVRALLAQTPSLATLRARGGMSLARFAAYNGQREIAYELLAAGADLDVFDAASFGAVNELSIMLDLDPNLAEAVSDDGYYPLHFACLFDQLPTVRVLLGHAASFRLPSQNEEKVYPLHSAVQARSLHIVDELLDRGADPNVRKRGDITPLMIAAQQGDETLVNQLLDRGADPTATASDGKDAARLARDAGFTILARKIAWAAGIADDEPDEPFVDDPGVTFVDGMAWETAAADVEAAAGDSQVEAEPAAPAAADDAAERERAQADAHAQAELQAWQAAQAEAEAQAAAQAAAQAEAQAAQAQAEWHAAQGAHAAPPPAAPEEPPPA
jgi:hypothetical protein